MIYKVTVQTGALIMLLWMSPLTERTKRILLSDREGK